MSKTEELFKILSANWPHEIESGRHALRSFLLRFNGREKKILKNSLCSVIGELSQAYSLEYESGEEIKLVRRRLEAINQLSILAEKFMDPWINSAGSTLNLDSLFKCLVIASDVGSDICGLQDTYWLIQHLTSISHINDGFFPSFHDFYTNDRSVREVSDLVVSFSFVIWIRGLSNNSEVDIETREKIRGTIKSILTGLNK